MVAKLGQAQLDHKKTLFFGINAYLLGKIRKMAKLCLSQFSHCQNQKRKK